MELYLQPVSEGDLEDLVETARELTGGTVCCIPEPGEGIEVDDADPDLVRENRGQIGLLFKISGGDDEY